MKKLNSILKIGDILNYEIKGIDFVFHLAA